MCTERMHIYFLIIRCNIRGVTQDPAVVESFFQQLYGPFNLACISIGYVARSNEEMREELLRFTEDSGQNKYMPIGRTLIEDIAVNVVIIQ